MSFIEEDVGEELHHLGMPSGFSLPSTLQYCSCRGNYLAAPAVKWVSLYWPTVSIFTHMRESCHPLPQVTGCILIGGCHSPSCRIFIGSCSIYGPSYLRMTLYTFNMPPLLVHDCFFVK
jgi:hypothetical protein